MTHNQPPSVSAIQLLAKLSHIKSTSSLTSHNKQKQLKHLQQHLSFYEQYCMGSLAQFESKLLNVKRQIESMKKVFREVENEGVVRFDAVEKMLERTLGEYEGEMRKGEGMVREMVREVQERLEGEVVSLSLLTSQQLTHYLHLNTRLQSTLSSLSSMQHHLLSQYQSLRQQLNQKFSFLQQQLTTDLQECDRSAMDLIRKLEKIEVECEEELKRIDSKKERLRYQVHQMLGEMVGEVVGGEQTK